jgi:hypothetical protein
MLSCLKTSAARIASEKSSHVRLVREHGCARTSGDGLYIVPRISPTPLPVLALPSQQSDRHIPFLLLL